MKELAELFVREKIMQQVFVELNNFTELKPSLDTVIKYLKTLTDCDNIAIRLKTDDGGYPYYTYDGFTEEFISHEDDICLKDLNGNNINKDGQCLLQCMCGIVINGIFQPNPKFLNEGGSFYTNDSSFLMTSLTQEDKNILNIRGYCHECGFESIALIPIRHNGTIIGLMQFNDNEKNKFHKNLITFLQMVGIQIGISIRNRYMYSELLNKYNLLLNTCSNGGINHDN